MLDDDDIALIEIHVIQDVIDAVEALLRQTERSGRQLTAPRSRIYATVLYAVVASAREQAFRPTLDAADVLDSILDGAGALHPGNVLAQLIETHTSRTQTDEESRRDILSRPIVKCACMLRGNRVKVISARTVNSWVVTLSDDAHRLVSLIPFGMLHNRIRPNWGGFGGAGPVVPGTARWCDSTAMWPGCRHAGSVSATGSRGTVFQGFQCE